MSDPLRQRRTGRSASRRRMASGGPIATISGYPFPINVLPCWRPRRAPAAPRRNATGERAATGDRPIEDIAGRNRRPPRNFGRTARQAAGVEGFWGQSKIVWIRVACRRNPDYFRLESRIAGGGYRDRPLARRVYSPRSRSRARARAGPAPHARGCPMARSIPNSDDGRSSRRRGPQSRRRQQRPALKEPHRETGPSVPPLPKPRFWRGYPPR